MVAWLQILVQLSAVGMGAGAAFPAEPLQPTHPSFPLVLPEDCSQQLCVLHFPLSWLISLASAILSSPAWGVSS